MKESLSYPELICSGQIPVEQAQKAIAADWTAAYAKYVGPLPTAQPSAPAPASTPVVVTPEPAAAGVPGNPDGSCPANAPIKVSRSGIYHQPTGDPNYANTKARLCFSTPQAAEQAGYRAPKR